MLPNKKRIIWILLFVLLFLSGIAGGFFYFSKGFGPERMVATVQQEEKQPDNSSFIRIYYPSEGRLLMEERRVKRQVSLPGMAEEVMKEFLKGPSQMNKSGIPIATSLLGIYPGSDGILYVDLSDEFRRNFQGDAIGEFLLLKGLYDSILANVTGVDDVKILIEGKEIESIGGHLFALHPLKNTLAQAK